MESYFSIIPDTSNVISFSDTGMGRLAGGTLNPSVVYSTYLQQTQQGQSSKPNAVSAKAGQWLRANGMRAVVVGHQPVGDAPLIMQAHGVQVSSCTAVCALMMDFCNALCYISG